MRKQYDSCINIVSQRGLLLVYGILFLNFDMTVIIALTQTAVSSISVDFQGPLKFFPIIYQFNNEIA